MGFNVKFWSRIKMDVEVPSKDYIPDVIRKWLDPQPVKWDDPFRRIEVPLIVSAWKVSAIQKISRCRKRKQSSDDVEPSSEGDSSSEDIKESSEKADVPSNSYSLSFEVYSGVGFINSILDDLESDKCVVRSFKLKPVKMETVNDFFAFSSETKALLRRIVKDD